YTGEQARWFAARGHEVRVVTAPPYYPAWRVGTGYRAWQYRREQHDGVQVWRAPLWVPSRPSGLKRVLHLASFAASSVPCLLAQWRWRP
ncbi:colanic acid biosynthesis glycosyltransferase WcaI, partial [Salmonella enterica subsp. enterica]